MHSTKTRIISITSGESRSGKTSLTRSMAWILASKGNKVCLIDHDSGLPGFGVLSGIHPPAGKEGNVLFDLPLSYAANVICLGLDFIPGIRLGIDCLSSVDCYDYVLVDHPTGINNKILSFCPVSSELILVLKPSKTSLAKSFYLLKSLSQNQFSQTAYMLLNRVPVNFDAYGLMDRFRAKCKSSLGLTLSQLGFIPEDPVFENEMLHQALLTEKQANCPGVLALEQAAKMLLSDSSFDLGQEQCNDFWELSLSELIKSNLFQTFAQNSRPETCSMQGLSKDKPKVQDPRKQSMPSPAKPLAAEAARQRPEPAPAGPSLNPSNDQAGEKGLKIGMICLDRALRLMLEDMFRAKGYIPKNAMADNGQAPDILVCSIKSSEKNYLDILDKYNKLPCIWLSEYKKFAPDWLKSLKKVQILEKPFYLENIYRAVEKAAGQNKG